MRSIMGADSDDRAIIDYLLAHHPAMARLDEVLALEDVEHPRESIDRLADHGLVSRLGELVGTTLACRRAAAVLGQ
jgi:hypothetical protein